MEQLRRIRERDMMDLQRTRREDADKAREMHDKVKSGHDAHRQKKKTQLASYRNEARKADFGARPGEDVKSATVSLY